MRYTPATIFTRFKGRGIDRSVSQGLSLRLSEIVSNKESTSVQPLGDKKPSNSYTIILLA